MWRDIKIYDRKCGLRYLFKQILKDFYVKKYLCLDL